MSEAKKPKGPAKKHIIDVEEPGKSAPTSTSKPVIVTNRPILKDPMVVEKSEDDSKPAEAQLAAKSSKPAIQPLSAPALPDTKAAAKSEKPEAENLPADKPETPLEEAEEPAKPATEEPAPEAVKKEDSSSAEETKTNEQEPEDGKTPDKQPDTESDDTKSSTDEKPVSETEKKLAAEEAEQAKHDTAVQKLVDSKQYELPINAIEKRKTKRFVVLGILLAVLLALAWTDIALDASLIQVNGVKPVTHFFSN